MSPSGGTPFSQRRGEFEDAFDDDGWVSEGDTPEVRADKNHLWDESQEDRPFYQLSPAGGEIPEAIVGGVAQDSRQEPAEKKQIFGEDLKREGAEEEEKTGSVKAKDDGGESPHAFRSWSTGQMGAVDAHNQLLLTQQHSQDRDAEEDETEDEGMLIPQLEVVQEEDEDDEESSDDGAEYQRHKTPPGRMIPVPNTGAILKGHHDTSPAFSNGSGRGGAGSEANTPSSCDEFIVKR